MVIGEAIKRLVEIKEKCRGNTVELERQRIALNLAASALDMRRPRKPFIWGDGEADGAIVYDMFDCPNCGRSYEIEDRTNYCPDCGQALDWSDYDE